MRGRYVKRAQDKYQYMTIKVIKAIRGRNMVVINGQPY